MDGMLYPKKEKNCIVKVKLLENMFTNQIQQETFKGEKKMNMPDVEITYMNEEEGEQVVTLKEISAEIGFGYSIPNCVLYFSANYEGKVTQIKINGDIVWTIEHEIGNVGSGKSIQPSDMFHEVVESCKILHDFYVEQDKETQEEIRRDARDFGVLTALNRIQEIAEDCISEEKS